MKKELELNQAILKIIKLIQENFPELLKNQEETPLKIVYTSDPDVNLKNLEDYRDSLQAMLKRYRLDHHIAQCE